jgi:hypothetical protein
MPIDIPFPVRVLTAVELLEKDGAFVKAKEAAKMLGVCRATLYNWNKAGIFPCFRNLDGYRYYLRRHVRYAQRPGVGMDVRKWQFPLPDGL